MTSCTNSALGEALGLSHSSVSRMRSGGRTGSNKTLLRLADLSEVPFEDVARAAEAAKTGELEAWQGILEKACGAMPEPETESPGSESAQAAVE